MTTKVPEYTFDQLRDVSVAELFAKSLPVFAKGKAAAFRVIAPCGCVTEVALQELMVDITRCVNAADSDPLPTNPKDLN